MKKILIVDDEKEIVKTLGSWLKKRGYKISVAYDSLEGLEKVKKSKPDLLILDVVMPPTNGIDLYREVSYMYGAIPAIFITGHPDEMYENSATNLGAIDYVVKPVKLRELLKTIKRVLSTLDDRD